MPIVLDRSAAEEYLQLVRAFPLISITDGEHLSEALHILDKLFDQPDRSAAEEAYLGALTDLVETYENHHITIPPVSGVEALRYLMQENELTQSDLVPLLGTASIVSEVLAGKRHLALSHIQRLATFFGMPADVFIRSGQAKSRE